MLDVETDGLRGDLTYWTASCEHGDRDTGTDAASLWRRVLSHQGGRKRTPHAWRDHVWWAHNGGSYDYLYLLGPARDDVAAGRAVVSIVSRADSIIGLRVSQGTTGHSHRTDLRDSFALLTAGLRPLAEQLAPELPKLAAPFDDDGRGFDPALPAHREYAMRDADSLLAVLVRFRGILVDEFAGTLPSWSAASTALRAWRATLPAGSQFVAPHPAAANLARAGYTGGIVPIRDTRWLFDMVTVDMNSMYPYVMRAHGVPSGDARAVRRYVPGAPGFYRANVTVPADEPWPFLAYRDPTGALAWPTGRFTTVASSRELARAIERGYRVDVIEGWIWSETAHPFDEFVGRYEALRLRGGAFSTAAKFIGNGLYGKFGTRPVHDEWRIAPACPGPDWVMPPFDVGDDEAFERHRGLWVHPGVPLHADYLMPHWAATITANARLRLAELADAIGPDAIAYGDTDSLTFPADRLARLGPDLLGQRIGQAKVEHRWLTFRAHAPKVYEGMLADRGPCDWLRKAKGIPRGRIADAFEHPDEPVTWDSPTGSLQVLQGADMHLDRTRRLSHVSGSLAWRLAADGTVHPIHLGGIDSGA